jgi:hypothetical protein
MKQDALVSARHLREVRRLTNALRRSRGAALLVLALTLILLRCLDRL